jgi:hypothetical protein
MQVKTLGSGQAFFAALAIGPAATRWPAIIMPVIIASVAGFILWTAWYFYEKRYGEIRLRDWWRRSPHLGDLSLCNAVRYLAHDSTWGHGADPNRVLLTAAIEMESALQAGGLDAWGRIPDDLDHWRKPIDREYWKQAELDHEDFMGADCRGRTRHKSMLASALEYVDVHLDRRQVERKWRPHKPRSPSKRDIALMWGFAAATACVVLFYGYRAYQEHENAATLAALTEGHWQPLSAEESEALRPALRSIPAATIYIRCNDERCRALENSFRQVFRDVGWKVDAQRNDDPMPDGLSITPGNDATAIANAVEVATGGRLVIASGATSPDGAIHLFIGEKPD